MITCANYDYIEIACLYKYPVKLQLKDRSLVEGIAENTKINKAHRECIILKTGNIETPIELNEIETMASLKKNPHFHFIRFEIQ